MTGAERAIRYSTVAAVGMVAAIAGWVSYEHALAVVRAHGEGGAVARLYPATVDGLIYSASMVLLDAARRGERAPRLARVLLACGIGATLFANVLAGLAYGTLGAAVAAWPALALVGSYELLMLLIRAGSGTPGSRVPAQVPSIRQLKEALKVGQPVAERVQAYLASSPAGAAGAPERAPAGVTLNGSGGGD